jgi:hypothetical protein
MPDMTVDQFIATQVPPQFHPVVATLRALVKDSVPQSQEIFSYGMPCFKVKRILAYLTPNKQGITFSFVHGVQFEDKYALLRGKAKWARYVKLTQVADINPEALRYYLAQALTFDAH